MQIVPAILEKYPTSVFSQIKRLLPYFKNFQIDIADGRFVPNRTFQIEQIIEFFPHFHFQNYSRFLSFDFHLMVKDFETEIGKLEKLRNLLKIKTVFVHVSLRPNVYYLKSNFPKFSFGLVLNPEDSIDKLTTNYQLRTIASIQIMSVNPGFQGSPFIKQTLQKIEELRLKGYKNKIYLDGGVNQESLPTIVSLKHKPDYLCVGSFLTKAKNLKDKVKFLRSLSV